MPGVRWIELQAIADIDEPPTWSICQPGGCRETAGADRCRPCPRRGAARLGEEAARRCRPRRRLARGASALLRHGAGVAVRRLSPSTRSSSTSRPCAQPPAHAGSRASWMRWIRPGAAWACCSGEAMDYDVLSLNVGSTLNPPAMSGTRVLPMRPLSRLRPAVEALLHAVDKRPLRPALHRHRRWRRRRGLRVAARRAGATACAAARSRGPRRPRHPRCDPAPGPVRRREASARCAPCARAGVTLQLGTSWCDTIARSSDLVLWATGAESHAWQRDRSAARRAGRERTRLRPHRRAAAIGLAPAGIRGRRLCRVAVAAAQGRRVRRAHGAGSLAQPACRAGTRRPAEL